MAKSSGYTYLGYNATQSITNVFFARPWDLTPAKDPRVESFIYFNTSEKEIFKKYNHTLQIGTLQAHLFEMFEKVNTVKIDLIRTKDSDKGRKESGEGLKDPELNTQGRNPHISQEQGSFITQVKVLLRALEDMGYEDVLAEPSDIRRARIYMAAGLQPMPDKPEMLQGSIKTILSR